MRNLKSLLFVALLTVASGCSHTVGYKLTKEDLWRGPKIDKVLRVVPLEDRTSAPTNRVVQTDGGKWRTNFRKGYANGELAPGVSAMIAKHLAHSGLFKKVVYGDGQAGDWELTGSLHDYSAMGRIHSTAEGIQAGTAGFGLIGALAGAATTWKMETEIRAAVKLEQLRLVDTATQSPLWTGSVALSTNYPASFQAAGEMVVFHHSDALLKQAVSELIRTIGTQRRPD